MGSSVILFLITLWYSLLSDATFFLLQKLPN